MACVVEGTTAVAVVNLDRVLKPVRLTINTKKTVLTEMGKTPKNVEEMKQIKLGDQCLPYMGARDYYKCGPSETLLIRVSMSLLHCVNKLMYNVWSVGKYSSSRVGFVRVRSWHCV